MKILCVCTQGQNRSKYLAYYLKKKGYETDYGGVDILGANPLRNSQVEWAEVIICVREKIKKLFLMEFDPEDKPVYNLEILDNPKRMGEWAIKIASKDWDAFQEQYVYSEIRKQIEKILPELDSGSIS